MTRPDPVLEKFLQEHERKLIRAQTDLVRFQQQPRRGSAGEAFLESRTEIERKIRETYIGDCFLCETTRMTWAWEVDVGQVGGSLSGRLSTLRVNYYPDSEGSVPACVWTGQQTQGGHPPADGLYMEVYAADTLNHAKLVYADWSGNAAYTIPTTEWNCLGPNTLSRLLVGSDSVIAPETITISGS